MSGNKNNMAKACEISEKTKKIVWERDEGKCVACGCIYAAPNAHYIRRSQGGLGVPENIVTLCTNFGNGCHSKFDSGTKEQKEEIGSKIREHLKKNTKTGMNPN